MHSLSGVARLLSRQIAVKAASQQLRISSVPVAEASQRWAIGLKYVAGVSAAAWASQQEGVVEGARLAYLIPVRLARDVYTAAAIVADYKVSLRGAESEERQQVLHQCHQRGADRLLKLCFDNGGIYIKLGQHIGQLDHLLPEEYVLTMRRHLLDKCPVSSWPEVRSIITEDLGAPPEQLFRSFEQQPIASASLAQVHRAVSLDGQSLAVKVQHAGLRESCEADVRTIEFLVQAVRRVFPDFNYQWLVDEIKFNLPKELDFTHEAANAERCRALLDSRSSQVRGRVHIPRLHHGLLSPRVLTMEFIDGIGVTDTASLEAQGISVRQLSQLVSKTFNEMIFIHGDVHCDPHAANLLVRKVNGQTQLVLLDHGLYRQIDDEFRQQYAALWRALIFADKQGIKQHSEAMNAGDMYPLFAALLTLKPWDEVTQLTPDKLTLEGSHEEKTMIQNYAQIYAKDIGELLLRVPRPLLLLLKTNDCLRAVDLALAQPVNNTIITARACTRALHQFNLQQARGLWQHAGAYWHGLVDAVHVELVMAILSMMSWWSRVTLGAEQRRQLAEERRRRREKAIGSAEARAVAGLPAEFVAG